MNVIHLEVFQDLVKNTSGKNLDEIRDYVGSFDQNRRLRFQDWSHLTMEEICVALDANRKCQNAVINRLPFGVVCYLADARYHQGNIRNSEKLNSFRSSYKFLQTILKH